MPQQLAIDVSDAAGQLVNGFSASLEHSRNRLYWSACPGSPGLKRKQRFGTRATMRRKFCHAVLDSRDDQGRPPD